MILGVILVWVLASLLVGLTMILVLRRGGSPVSRLQAVEPRLATRAALAVRSRGEAGASCQRRVRRARAPRLRR